jgi:cell division protein FtsL
MTVVVEARSKGGVSLSVILLEIFPAVLAVALLAVVGMVHVTSRVLVVSVGYELSRLDSKATELSRENDQLKLELATLKAPARLEQAARQRLGLVSPPTSAVIHLEQK